MANIPELSKCKIIPAEKKANRAFFLNLYQIMYCHYTLYKKIQIFEREKAGLDESALEDGFWLKFSDFRAAVLRNVVFWR